MWGLLRLLLLSLCLGVALAAFALLLRSFGLLLYLKEDELGILSRIPLPKVAEPYRLPRRHQPPRILRGLADFGIAALCGLALSVFYFATNDGVPRLFSLLAVALGAYAFEKTVKRPCRCFLILLFSCVRAVLLMAFLVVQCLFCGVGKCFLTFLRKTGLRLIKRLERLYTKHASQRYGRHAARRLSGKHLWRALSAALDAEGGTNADRS